MNTKRRGADRIKPILIEIMNSKVASIKAIKAIGCYNLRFGCQNQNIWLNIAQPKLMHRTSFGAVPIHIVVASQPLIVSYHFNFGYENDDFSSWCQKELYDAAFKFGCFFQSFRYDICVLLL